jgi:hypothetical protein
MMMAKGVKDRYERVSDLIDDLRLIRGGQAPLFARSVLDLSQIPATGPAEPGPPATAAAQPASGARVDSRLFIVALVLMILSLLANLVLLMVMVGK